MLGLLLNSLAVFAQEVEVLGSGIDRGQAIQDALIQAVGEVNGIIIYGKSTLDKEELIEDRVTHTGFGFVRSYRVISEGALEGGYQVKVWADIRRAPEVIRSNEHQMITRPNLDRVESRKKIASDQVAYFTNRYGNLRQVVRDGYNFAVQGVSVDHVSPSRVDGSILVKLLIRQSYWLEYLHDIQKLASPGDMNSGIFAGGDCLAIKKGYHLPDFLLERDIPPIYANVEVGGFNRQILLIRDSAILADANQIYPVKLYQANIGSPNAQISVELGKTFLCRPQPNHHAPNQATYDALGVDSIEGYLYTDLHQRNRLIAASASYGKDPVMVFKIPFSVESVDQVLAIGSDVVVRLVSENLSGL